MQHRAVHRIKNMIILMEYIPNARNLRYSRTTNSSTPDLTPQQVRAASECNA